MRYIHYQLTGKDSISTPQQVWGMLVSLSRVMNYILVGDDWQNIYIKVEDSEFDAFVVELEKFGVARECDKDEYLENYPPMP